MFGKVEIGDLENTLPTWISMLPRTWIVAVRERNTSYLAKCGTLGVGFFGLIGRNEIRYSERGTV